MGLGDRDTQSDGEKHRKRMTDSWTPSTDLSLHEANLPLLELEPQAVRRLMVSVGAEIVRPNVRLSASGHVQQGFTRFWLRWHSDELLGRGIQRLRLPSTTPGAHAAIALPEKLCPIDWSAETIGQGESRSTAVSSSK
ncbi:hypothetical protein RRG08_051959 [Elysia crispata]|uniref:Uncharacterized protein n=1 Tax=Elysia crispata TaxID=231223 RepID=A0AAE1CRC5_9GAST|nr:hypothetical protein RRG08_051959 [Elysia crispata]